jgi:transcriptional regulator of heat shock response
VDITERQKEVLMAIIKEFMESADEVGSVTLLEKYDFGVSSATIRNEMVSLMEEGFLEKKHVSSGRFPTDQAIRMYVKKQLEDSQTNPMLSIEIKQGIYRERFNRDSVTNSILNLLSENTNSVAFVILDGILRYWGLSNILRYEELNNEQTLRSLINIIEDPSFLIKLCQKYGGSKVSLLIGEESGIQNLEECSIAFIKTSFWESKESYVGVLGSKRMDYQKVVIALKEVRNALQASMQGWS